MRFETRWGSTISRTTQILWLPRSCARAAPEFQSLPIFSLLLAASPATRYRRQPRPPSSSFLHCIALRAPSLLDPSFLSEAALWEEERSPPLTTKSSGPPKYLSSPNRTSLRLACDTRRSFASNFQLTQTPIACQQQTQQVLGKHQTYPRLTPKTRRTSSSRWVRLTSFISRRGACSARADIMRPAQYHPSDSALPTTCSPP